MRKKPLPIVEGLFALNNILSVREQMLLGIPVLSSYI